MNAPRNEASPLSSSPAETYEQYLAPAIAHRFTRVFLEYASPRVGERVLDVACGTGSVARHVAPLVGSSGKIVALDVDADMLRVARTQPAPAGPTIEWLHGDATSLDFADGAFDLVLCQQGLQFFPDRAAAAGEMRCVLANGGRIAVSVWQALELHPLHEALFDATARHLGVSTTALDGSFSLGDAEKLRALLSDAGFQNIEVAARSIDVHLATPERFVELTVLGAATSSPAFAHLDVSARSALVAAVADETQNVTGRFRDGDRLSFPMSTHIATAQTQPVG